METFSALLAICVGNSLVTGEFTAQNPVTWSFDIFFDLRRNKHLSNQLRGWLFETPSRQLWRHCNDDSVSLCIYVYDISMCYSSIIYIQYRKHTYIQEETWIVYTNTPMYIYIVLKLTFEILIVRRQPHSFATHERMFLWKCRSLWDRKCLDLRGTRTPNLRINAECSKHLIYQGQTFAVHCFWILVPVV